MRTNERLFLLAIAVIAAAVAASAVTEAGRILARSGREQAWSPTAGEPRDVDAQQIRRLIERGLLSDREALHYREAR